MLLAVDSPGNLSWSSSTSLTSSLMLRHDRKDKAGSTRGEDGDKCAKEEQDGIEEE